MAWCDPALAVSDLPAPQRPAVVEDRHLDLDCRLLPGRHRSLRGHLAIAPPRIRWPALIAVPRLVVLAPRSRPVLRRAGADLGVQRPAEHEPLGPAGRQRGRWTRRRTALAARANGGTAAVPAGIVAVAGRRPVPAPPCGGFRRASLRDRRTRRWQRAAPRRCCASGAPDAGRRAWPGGQA